MRKEHFLKLDGFDESPEYRFIEDWELWLRLTKQFGDIKILNIKMVNYRIYNVKGRDLSDDAFRVLCLIDKQYKNRMLSKKVYRHAYSNRYIDFASQCLQSHKLFSRLPLLKSLIYARSVRDKSRAILFLFASFLPREAYKFVKAICCKKHCVKGF